VAAGKTLTWLEGKKAEKKASGEEGGHGGLGLEASRGKRELRKGNRRKKGRTRPIEGLRKYREGLHSGKNPRKGASNDAGPG